MFAVLLALQGLTASAYALVHDTASFLIVACLAQVAGSGTGGSRNALVLGLSDHDARLEVLGQLRAALHLAGELLFVGASWRLSVPLMPPNAPGEYRGVFATGEAVAPMAAPALMTTLIAGWGQPGWFALAVIFLLPGLAAVPVTRLAIRTRPSALAVATGSRSRQ